MFPMSNKQSISEKDFQKQILEIAARYGWKRAHFQKVPIVRQNKTVRWLTPAAADGKGFPDLLLVHEKYGIIFCEIKTQKGILSPEQKEWAEALGRWAETCTVRPSDFDNIVRRLQGGQYDTEK